MSIGEYINDEHEQERRTVENLLNNMRVSIPGVVVDFDSEKQTVSVQPTIKEEVGEEWIQLPLLLDVPVVFQRAGGYCLTFPIKKDDECLVVFSDMCIDSWWQSSGIQTQLEKRRHDLSDAFAVIGITSVPKAVKEYSTQSVQLRNEDKTAYVEIAEDIITIKGKQLIIEMEEEVKVTTQSIKTESKDIESKTENIDIESEEIKVKAENSNVESIVDIKGDTTITGETNVLGDTSVDGEFLTTDDITIKKDLIVEKDLTVKGDAYLEKDLSVKNEITSKESIVDDIVFTKHVHKDVESGVGKSGTAINAGD